MSDSIPSREGSGFSSTRGSARLGLTLRAVLVSPEIGFASAIKSADRRARAGKRPAEGIYPYVLAGAGGASWFLLWLKVGGLIGLRDASGEAFEFAYLAVAVVLGAILGLSAQAIWSGLAVRASQVDRRSLRRDLRIAWGAAALPQLVALVALTPLDLAVVGSAIYTTDPMADPVSTAWSAFSIAVAGALGAWNVYLLARGTKVGLEIGSLRSAFVTGAALLILTVAFAPVIVFPAVTA
ncbi:MAG: hypothetical protein ACRDJV_04060 [Actinomycetota bacterium]